MKRLITSGVIVTVLGLLIALGPRFLFKVCAIGEDGVSHCHWSAQAELGVGFLIAGLGACILVFTDQKTHLGLLIGAFLAGIIALAIPNALIGGCHMMEMACRRIAFPALTVESVILLIFTAAVVIINEIKHSSTPRPPSYIPPA